MSITLKTVAESYEKEYYKFEGPYCFKKDESQYTYDVSELKSGSGVFVVVERLSEGCRVLDFGEAQDVHEGVLTHSRRNEWQKFMFGGELCVAVHYTTDMQQPDRQELALKLRKAYCPPCGGR